jgi:CRISPR-associated protein Cas5d
MTGLSMLEVKVWGDLACFTRPEMKVERVSYPVMTPSAARGVLESIFWKPEVNWRIAEIWVLRDIQYTSFVRNEVSTRQSYQSAREWATTGAGGYAAPDDRTQRHTLALRDVAYVIRGQLALNLGVQEHIAKYRDQFRRRVQRGQCHSTPYLGCREFSAFFGPPEPDDAPIALSQPLGSMLLDLEYDAAAPGTGQPRFFDAALEAGVLRVPHDRANGGR